VPAWQTTRPVSGRRTRAFEIRSHRRRVAAPDNCSHAPPAARDWCAAPLAPGHPREGGQAPGSLHAAADALPLKAALLHLDTDFELHRLSHGRGDAAVRSPARRRDKWSSSQASRRSERSRGSPTAGHAARRAVAPEAGSFCHIVTSRVSAGSAGMLLTHRANQGCARHRRRTQLIGRVLVLAHQGGSAAPSGADWRAASRRAIRSRP